MNEPKNLKQAEGGILPAATCCAKIVLTAQESLKVQKRFGKSVIEIQHILEAWQMASPAIEFFLRAGSLPPSGVRDLERAFDHATHNAPALGAPATNNSTKEKEREN